MDRSDFGLPDWNTDDCGRKRAGGILMPMVASFIVCALYGYLPYDGILTRAKKRQEELDRDFPNAVSKITLLVTAGMILPARSRRQPERHFPDLSGTDTCGEGDESVFNTSGSVYTYAVQMQQ